jgi:uncharacterized protein with NAD-binding domain and iron-sulfur cluster
MPERNKKLAILGGGIGSLVTAWQLTSQPNWQEIYQSITIYQTGWRLGGKCASGRGPNGRIEEHGLHIWFGFYDNSFDVIQGAYAMLGRSPGAPLASWSDAFKKHSYLVIAQRFEDQWYPWGFDFPMNDRVPGQDRSTPNLWQCIRLTIDFILRQFEQSRMGLHVERTADSPEQRSAVSLLSHAVEKRGLTFVGRNLGERILSALVSFLRELGDDLARHTEAQHLFIRSLLGHLRDWIRREFANRINVELAVHRLILLMDLAITTVLGLLSDRVLFHPNKLDAIDHLDLREWLSQHGALNQTVNSDLLRGLYDLVFGYRNGEIDKPTFAAGTAIRCTFRICFAYKGGIYWKMQAGMGDAVIAPLYLAPQKKRREFRILSSRQKPWLVGRQEIDRDHFGRQTSVAQSRGLQPLGKGQRSRVLAKRTGLQSIDRGRRDPQAQC